MMWTYDHYGFLRKLATSQIDYLPSLNSIWPTKSIMNGVDEGDQSVTGRMVRPA